MTAPSCLVIGAGRMTGGFVAPLLRDAGWRVVLACRDPEVRAAINALGGGWLRLGADPPRDRWLDDLEAVALDDGLERIAARADLVATAVGPSSLASVGQLLAPLLRARLDASPAPINVVTFENHRRAPELLMSGLIAADPSLAGQIGRRLGVGGAAVWRIIAKREVTDAGVRFRANDEDECYVDALALVPGAPPRDGSVPGLALVRAFDDRMVEKLWVFNAGHCAAAYLGWHAGAETLDAAMAHPAVREVVAAVVAETQLAVRARVASRPGAAPLPARPVESILARYVDPALRDPVARVGREPRRKLAPDDRLIGPAVNCLAVGGRPTALAAAAAAALTYGEPTDPQAPDLQRELALVGPEELLATVSGLDPSDELSKLICAQVRNRFAEEVAR